MIRVLVVDDSAVVRKVITEELARYNDIQIVGIVPSTPTSRGTRSWSCAPM